MNKQGQGSTIGAVFIGFLILVIAIYTAPVVEDAILQTRDSETYNCLEAVDYNATLETNKMGCGISFLISPLYILAAAILAIMMILYAYKQPSPEQQYTVGY